MPEVLLFAIGLVLTGAVFVAVWMVGRIDDGEAAAIRLDDERPGD